MSRFMLRSTLLATCVVALSASAAFGQSDTTLAGSDLAARALPTIMVPAAPAVAEKSLMQIAPAVEPVFEARSVNADVATVVAGAAYLAWTYVQRRGKPATDPR